MSATLNIVVVAAMPRARDSTAGKVINGLFKRERIPMRRSLSRESMGLLVV